MVISLERRDRQPEMMDQPGLDERRHLQALEGPRRANIVSNTARVLWRGLAATGVPLGSASSTIPVSSIGALGVGPGAMAVASGVSRTMDS